MDFIKKYKQTLLMAISAFIIIAFFLPWFSMNPDFKMFQKSDAVYSPFNILKGFSQALPTVNLMVQTYLSDSTKLKIASKLLYLVYTLWLVPLTGIAAIIMSGMRSKKAATAHLVQFIITLFFAFVILIVINISGDMRQLFNSMFNYGYGYFISVLLSAAGLFVVIQSKSKQSI